MNSNREQDTVWQEYQAFTQAFNYARQYNDVQYALFREGQIKEPHFIDIDEATRRVRRAGQSLGDQL